jgi:hypothetical protein
VGPLVSTNPELKAWLTACEKAGVPGMLRVAMTITGHRTRAVFDRYHIVSPGDLQEAARKLASTFSGTSDRGMLQPRSPSS